MHTNNSRRVPEGNGVIKHVVIVALFLSTAGISLSLSVFTVSYCD